MELRLLRRPALLFALAIALATSLRLPATQRGFFHFDEAQFLFGVQPAVLMLRDTLGIQAWPRPFVERPPFDRVPVPYACFSGKPAYDMLMIAWGTFAGLTPESVGMLSLAFGIGTIVLVYRIARRVFEARVALAAAFILAVSGYHVFYSGSQSSVATSAFFLLLATSLYLDSLDKRISMKLAAAGAVLAVAYGCHYNLLPYVLTFFGLEGLRLIVSWRQGLRDGILRLAVFSVSSLCVIGLFELFYRVLVSTAYMHVPQVPYGYLAQLHFQMGFLKWTTLSGMERFSRLLLDSEGALVCGLALLGWLACLPAAVRDRRKGTLSALSAAYFVAATLAGRRSPVFSRMTVIILPFLAIWGAAGLMKVADIVARLSHVRPAPIVAACVMVVTVVGIPKSYALGHLKSGYAESAQYVLKHGDGKQVVLGLPLEQFYLGSFEGTYGLPTSLEALRRLNESGVRLLVLDHYVHLLEEWGHPLGPTLRELARRVQPEVTIPNPNATTLVIVAEAAMSRETLARSLGDPHAGEIRIYDLSKILAVQMRPLESRTHPLSEAISQ